MSSSSHLLPPSAFQYWWQAAFITNSKEQCPPETSSRPTPQEIPHLTIILLYCMVNIVRNQPQLCSEFKFCKPVHHHTFQMIQPTRCNNFSSLLLEVYVQLDMFRASSRPSSEATTTAVAASGFTFGAWW